MRGLKQRLGRLEMSLVTPAPAADDLNRYALDPAGFAQRYWPQVTFYDKQWEIIESVRDNAETVVVAGHQLGKDFAAAFVVLWFYLTRHPVRVVTTSVKDDHLRVLWGEIGRYLDT